MNISIVIVGFNEYRNLIKSIPIIDIQCINIESELIYIDSSSTDKSIEYVNGYKSKNLKRIKSYLVPKKDFHHAKTRNLGFLKSSGEIVVFLGGDAIPQSGWLKNLIDPIQHNNIVATYSRQLPPTHLNMFNQLRMSYNYPQTTNLNATNIRKNYFSSVSCAIQRHVFSEILFNENVPVNEDSILANEILKLNYKIEYVPNSIVCHGHNYSKLEIFHRYIDGARTQVYFANRYLNNSDLNSEGFGFLKHIYKQKNKIKIKDLTSIFIYISLGYIGVKIGSSSSRLPQKINGLFGKYTKKLDNSNYILN